MSMYDGEDFVPAIEVQNFLREVQFLKASDLCLRFWRKQFFLWTGTHYKLYAHDDLKADVMYWLRQKDNALATNQHANELLTQLECFTLIDTDLSPPAWIEERPNTCRECIALDNGLLNIRRLMRGVIELLPHSPMYFNLNALPYDYFEHAYSPHWLTFLKKMLPNPDVQRHFQEWAGYLLVQQTTYDKFAILVGPGANGKSVACTALRAMLGADNVSSVLLESFKADRTFLLAHTQNKLANICEEIGDGARPAEGLLKQFVSGNPITVEHKRQTPFTLIPTARLMFATNVLPKFLDRTDAIWRRLLLLPFNVQILDESQQNKNLVDAEWWRREGSVRGIFNWALEGLLRLWGRGYFLEPEECLKAKGGYRHRCNGANDFFSEYCLREPNGKVASNYLHKRYIEWARSTDNTLLSAHQFAEEVKRQFTGIQLGVNPARQKDGSRCRVWQGLSFTGTDGTGDEAAEHACPTECA